MSERESPQRGWGETAAGLSEEPGRRVPVCRLADVPDGTAVRVEIGSEPVCVVHVDGEVFAIRDVCSHADVPLSEGEVEGATVECWLHGSRFDLRTGKPIGLPATVPVPVYETTVEDGTVLVDVAGGAVGGRLES